MDSNDDDFDERCYKLLLSIPRGKITTYSELAKTLNSTEWGSIENAMAKNQKLTDAPSHRVIRNNGTLGEYALGAYKKSELLLEEGVDVRDGKVINFESYIHKFGP